MVDHFKEFFERRADDWSWTEVADFRQRHLIRGLTRSIVKATGG